MKTIIHKQPFLNLLQLATKFNSNKLNSLSSLQGILIEGKEEEMSFYSTNLNLFFSGSISSQTSEPFKILIEPKKIMEFLTLLKEEQIEVEIKETAITLKQKNAKGNFPLLKLTDFPLPPTIKESEQKISNELFLKNLPYFLENRKTFLSGKHPRI